MWRCGCVLALDCGSDQWMDGSGMWGGCMANTWEEMRRNLEPVSPAPSEEPEVITIEDTPNPLGDEAPFEVVEYLIPLSFEIGVYQKA